MGVSRSDRPRQHTPPATAPPPRPGVADTREAMVTLVRDSAASTTATETARPTPDRARSAVPQRTYHEADHARGRPPRRVAPPPTTLTAVVIAEGCPPTGHPRPAHQGRPQGPTHRVIALPSPRPQAMSESRESADRTGDRQPDCPRPTLTRLTKRDHAYSPLTAHSPSTRASTITTPADLPTARARNTVHQPPAAEQNPHGQRRSHPPFCSRPLAR